MYDINRGSGRETHPWNCRLISYHTIISKIFWTKLKQTKGEKKCFETILKGVKNVYGNWSQSLIFLNFCVISVQ